MYLPKIPVECPILSSIPPLPAKTAIKIDNAKIISSVNSFSDSITCFFAKNKKNNPKRNKNSKLSIVQTGSLITKLQNTANKIKKIEK